MAELATIARPYAQALFGVAQSGNLSAWADMADELKLVASHPDVVALAHHPKVPATIKVEIFLSALKSPVTPEAKNFIETLVEYDRLTLLPEIVEQFHVLKNAQEGTFDAQVFSAFDMNATQVEELKAVLEQKFGRKLHPKVTLDSSLIGGVRVVVGDQVLDTSVRAKLQKMHTALTA